MESKKVSTLSSSPIFDNQIVSLSEREEKNSFAEVKQHHAHIENDSDWLNTEEAAIYLRFLKRDGTPCEHSLRNFVSQGRVPFYKPFGRLLFKRSELRRLIESAHKGGFKCR